MAWPERLNSQSHRPAELPGPGRAHSNASHHHPLAAQQGRHPNPNRMRDYSILNNANFQVDASSSSEDLHPSRPSRPHHGRSMSQPFPSLFSGSGKKKSKQQNHGGRYDSDSGEDGQMPKFKKPIRGHRAVTSKDFATGNCMTCGSLVRWPRELQLFKCTICLTINDLQPPGGDPRKDGNQRAPQPGRDRSGSIKIPISIEHTRTLIAECLRSHLRRALSGTTRDSHRDESGATSSSYAPDLAKDPLGASSTSYAVRPKPSATLAQGPASLLDHSVEPAVHHDPLHKGIMSRSYSTSYPDRRPSFQELAPHRGHQPQQRQPSPDQEAKQVFKQLEVYISGVFTSFQCLNSSFSTYGSNLSGRSRGDSIRLPRPPPPQPPQPEPRKELYNGNYPIVDLDPKLLLLGDFAENGSWWTGSQDERRQARTASHRSHEGPPHGMMRSPYIDWAGLEEWYMTVVEAARTWLQVYDELVREDVSLAATDSRLWELEAQILAAQEHVQRTLLKATETILKRPGRPIATPHELRFLLIIAENPLLHASGNLFKGQYSHPELINGQGPDPRGSGPTSGKHSGIIKRILGLIANSSADCRNHLEAWLSRYPQPRFVRLKDLIGGFLNYRLTRENEKKHEVKFDVTGGLIPNMTMGQSPASLYAALEQSVGPSRPSGLNAKKPKEMPRKTMYQESWQIKAAAKVMSLLFEANNLGYSRRALTAQPESLSNGSKERVQAPGQIVATSDFYMTLLDDSDLVADFEAWEQRRKFAFCQFPFLLSIWSKIQILEYDAKRQMQNKARDAFFDSILTNRRIEQYLVISVQRECLVRDSLEAVSRVISNGGEDIKKGLRVTFTGEEGVDAGGLRKEWFLLLIREVFNPEYGMFIYDEDSQYCYFNPNSFEPSEQYNLVGVVFGLAIYNSTILDVAFPPFAFRKLLNAAPAPAAQTAASQTRSAMVYTLDDLAEYRPRLAASLRDLLEYDGDVESTFCLDFTVGLDKYGAQEAIPLCQGGERRVVTNANRREFVDLYVRYVLDTSVVKQFEPFKRGFFTVCGGNALSLFRPEEIELLVRGSDEALDIGSLKVAAEYDNWGVSDPAHQEPTVMWFWGSFEKASPQDQRKLLSFITGSDRIPAMGAASLTIRISCLGEDCGRFPLARTCFNMLSLSRYRTRERLETTLWRAVRESEGFGLK